MTFRNIVAAVGLSGLMAASGAAQPKIEKSEIAYTQPGSGKAMFNEYCAVCHGQLGKGDGPAAKALTKAPADLTQLAVKSGGKFPELKIKRYISGDDTVAAHGSRDMPIWGKLFHSIDPNTAVDEIRIRNLSDYIKTLQAK